MEHVSDAVVALRMFLLLIMIHVCHEYNLLAAKQLFVPGQAAQSPRHYIVDKKCCLIVVPAYCMYIRMHVSEAKGSVMQGSSTKSKQASKKPRVHTTTIQRLRKAWRRNLFRIRKQSKSGTIRPKHPGIDSSRYVTPYDHRRAVCCYATSHGYHPCVIAAEANNAAPSCMRPPAVDHTNERHNKTSLPPGLRQSHRYPTSPCFQCFLSLTR